MAYVQKNQMLEEEQGPQAPGAPTAPTIAGPSLGSTASLGGTAGNVGAGGLGAQGAQAQGAGAGTGFTNIDRVLGANTNAGADLKKSADDSKAKEGRNFNVGANAAMMAVNNGGTGLTGDQRTDLIKGLQTDTSQYQNVEKETPIEGGVLKYNERVQTQGDDRTKAIDLAKNALSQTYTGPTEFKYDVGNTKDAQQLRAMGNAQSAGVALADKAGPLANYNTGLSAIDQAIYGSAGNAGTVNQIAADAKAQTEGQLAQQKSISDRAKAAQDSIASGQGDLRRELERLGGQFSAVDAARGVNTNQGSLQAIGKVLGDTSLGATPNAPRPGPTLAQQPVQQQQAQAPTPQFSGEDRKAYDNLVRLGYAPAQAAQRISSQIASNVGQGDTGESIAAMLKRGMSKDQIKAALGISDEIYAQFGGG